MHIKTCTCTFNVCTLYVHCTNLSVHGTDMFIILNVCAWFTLVHLGSPVSVHCLYTVCKLSVLDNLYIHVCTLYIHVWTWYRHVLLDRASFKQCYSTGICHSVHTVFRHVYTPQKWLWQVVSFPVVFLQNSVCQLLNTV